MSPSPRCPRGWCLMRWGRWRQWWWQGWGQWSRRCGWGREGWPGQYSRRCQPPTSCRTTPGLASWPCDNPSIGYVIAVSETSFPCQVFTFQQIIPLNCYANESLDCQNWGQRIKILWLILAMHIITEYYCPQHTLNQSQPSYLQTWQQSIFTFIILAQKPYKPESNLNS